MPFEQSDTNHGAGQNDLFARFEAREAECCSNIFPSCSAQRKGKGVGYQKRADMGLADLWGWGCWRTPLPWESSQTLLNMLQVAEAESR